MPTAVLNLNASIAAWHRQANLLTAYRLLWVLSDGLSIVAKAYFFRTNAEKTALPLQMSR
jgi:hypothetical protein